VGTIYFKTKERSTDGQDESGFTQESDDNKESARDGAHAPRIAPSESPGLA